MCSVQPWCTLASPTFMLPAHSLPSVLPIASHTCVPYRLQHALLMLGTLVTHASCTRGLAPVTGHCNAGHVDRGFYALFVSGY